MRSHPFLRAYMAGITVPTVFLLVVLTVVITLRHLHHLPVAIERFVVFPMAVVPNTWGIWNLLRVASPSARALPLGWYGGLLALLLPPLGAGVAAAIGFELPAPPAPALAVAWLVAVIAYYLAWKLLVGYLNELVGVDA